MKRPIAIKITIVSALIFLHAALANAEDIIWKNAKMSINDDSIKVGYSLQQESLLVIKFTNLNQNSGARFAFTILFEHEVDGESEYYDFLDHNLIYNRGKTDKIFHVRKGDTAYYTIHLPDVGWFKRVLVPIYDLTETNE